MRGCLPAWIHWIISETLTESRKFHMRDLYATCCGVILMIDVVGVSVLEVLGIPLVWISPNSSLIPMVSTPLLELTSWLWRDIVGCINRNSSQSFQLPITATAVAIKQPLWKC